MRKEIVDILIAAFSALLGAIVGGWFTLRIERRKAKVEREKVAAKEAYQASLRLQELLADWYTGIDEAVTYKASAAGTIDKLRTFHRALRFEPRLTRELIRLRDEPLCNQLSALTSDFHEEALDSKGNLRMDLEARYPRCDYNLHKEEAMRALKKHFEAFDRELDRVTKLLDKKAKQIP